MIDWVIDEANKGNRYDKSGLCDRTRHLLGNKSQRLDLIDQLIDGNDLEVIPWPAGERPSRASRGYVQRKNWGEKNMGGTYDKRAEGEA